ncbi:hypothetical protein ATL10_1007147 [Bacillus sp. 196mf]|nr:hypothetical protein ATL10_1007147 [Bacillus sp. 196mf]SFL56840.1 hypothetical protein SAMN04488573_103121 [Bacillus sp. 5mfcol3.1]
MISKLIFGYKKPTEHMYYGLVVMQLFLTQLLQTLLLSKKETVIFYLVAVWKVPKQKMNAYIVNY